MEKKTHLRGEIDSPAGSAPLAAWKSVEGEVRRPEDLWLSGHAPTLLEERSENWRARIAERLQLPPGPMGLRARFVYPHLPEGELDLVALTGALLAVMPESWEGLFLHSEVMTGPESGVYLAFENRPPALLTQVLLEEGAEPRGEFAPVSGPLHLNVLLHDSSLGFRNALRSGLLENLPEKLAGLISLEPAQIHELSMARSDAHPKGISIGLEQVWEEQGSRGGFSATEAGSRSLPGEGGVL